MCYFCINCIIVFLGRMLAFSSLHWLYLPTLHSFMFCVWVEIENKIINNCFGSFNDIMSVLGRGTDEMLAVHLAKSYCLPILLYGCEIWYLTSSDKQKVDVAWNDCFRKIFNTCSRESAECNETLLKVYKFAHHQNRLRSSYDLLYVVRWCWSYDRE